MTTLTPYDAVVAILAFVLGGVAGAFFTDVRASRRLHSLLEDRDKAEATRTAKMQAEFERRLTTHQNEHHANEGHQRLVSLADGIFTAAEAALLTKLRGKHTEKHP